MEHPTVPSVDPVELDRQSCVQLDQALAVEWLEGNGRQAYAASTVPSCPTRRHHGLLVVTPADLAEAHVFLSRMEEVLRVEGQAFPLSVARYPDTWAPEGHLAMEGFRLHPFPEARYRCGDFLLRRQWLMAEGRNLLLLCYQVEPGPSSQTSLELELRPLLACRPASALTRENEELDGSFRRLPDGFRCRPYQSLPPVDFTVGGGPHRFLPDPVWYRNFILIEDQKAERDHQEDHFSPGILRFPLRAGRPVALAVSVEGPERSPLKLWLGESGRRRQRWADTSRCLGGRVDWAARIFRVRRRDQSPGLAPYPPQPFQSGVDTFITLPGLGTACGRLSGAAQVLDGIRPYQKDGLLPSHIATDGEGHRWESLEPSLWFAWSVRHFQKAGGDSAFLHERMLPVLEGIHQAVQEGLAVLGLALDPSQLLHREGHFPLQLNALWYAFLAQLEHLYRDRGQSRTEKRFRDQRRAARREFLRRFWMPERGYLACSWSEAGPEPDLKADAVVAASLEWSPLTKARRAQVVQAVRKDLLTPFGLRLAVEAGSKQDDREVGEEESGSTPQPAYPWLLGFFAEAALRAWGPRRRVLEEIQRIWRGPSSHMDGFGLDQIAESFEDRAPYGPIGAPAHAMNLAELRRSLDMLERRAP